MATIYNNLDEYLNNSSDEIDLNTINFNNYHDWQGYRIFIDSVNKYFHIPKDTVFKVKQLVGSTTLIIGYRASSDVILKEMSSATRRRITNLYTPKANIKFYNSNTLPVEKKYLGYLNFGETFNYQQIHSVATYPWIKIGTNAYRSRLGDWDLNGNTSGSDSTMQALCRSGKEAYMINHVAVWPDTYQRYLPGGNTWIEYPPELTTSTEIKEIDRSDHRTPQIVYRWPQRDYRFDNRYITSCNTAPEIGSTDAPYQFSQEYETTFAQTKPTTDEKSKKVINMGFAPLLPAGKKLCDPEETFDGSGIKYLKVSWTDGSNKTKCDIVASDINDTNRKFWTQIPKGRSLGIRIRLPGNDWQKYGEERLASHRTHEVPIQLPIGVYAPSTKHISLYNTKPQPAYDWTWETARKNKPWWRRNDLGIGFESFTSADFRYIPQLKIKFANKYYYAKATLASILAKVNANNNVSILLSTGEFVKSTDGRANTLSFRAIKDGDTQNPITINLETIGAFGEQFGWKVKKLHQDGRMDQWDSRNGAYQVAGQSEFNDRYLFNGWTGQSDPPSAHLLVLNNIDLFGDIETITTTENFKDFFHAPKNQINGWITTCKPTAENNRYATLDWSYNLILKSRLLPYMDQMFLPITGWKNRYHFSGTDQASGQFSAAVAWNKDLWKTTPPFYGYTVGVRVYNANDDRIDESPIWDDGPIKDIYSGQNRLGKGFSIHYDKNTWADINNQYSLHGAYRNRNSMAYQFRNYTLDEYNNYFTDPDHFIALPVGLVLE